MITALFGLMLAASEATAATSATTAQASAAAEAPKEEKKICKREEASESRLAAKRVCLTAAQWRERRTGVKGLGDGTK